VAALLLLPHSKEGASFTGLYDDIRFMLSGYTPDE